MTNFSLNSTLIVRFKDESWVKKNQTVTGWSLYYHLVVRILIAIKVLYIITINKMLHSNRRIIEIFMKKNPFVFGTCSIQSVVIHPSLRQSNNMLLIQCMCKTNHNELNFRKDAKMETVKSLTRPYDIQSQRYKSIWYNLLNLALCNVWCWAVIPKEISLILYLPQSFSVRFMFSNCFMNSSFLFFHIY